MVSTQEVQCLPEVERQSLIPVKAVASSTTNLTYKEEDLPPLPEPTLRQGVSDMGRAWSETTSAPARSGESTIYSEKGPEEVAQAAQVKGLPDLDHARHLFAMSAAVSVEVAPTEISRRVRDLERPLL